MKVIILGSKGQLGSEFVDFLKDKVNLFSFSHKELDILNLKVLIEKFSEIKPDIVINCAAYINVDKAEDEKDLTYLTNVIGARNSSYASYKVNSKIIFFSTDYIFDGTKISPYTELDEPNPLSIYGKTKLLGEINTKLYNPNHLILRISWLYGLKGINFIKKIIDLSKANETIKVVNDQIGTPTYTFDVVKQTYELIKKDYVGLFHSSNEGFTTWYKFSIKIVEKLNLNVKIVPIKTEELKLKAKRPKYSVLENYNLKLENLNIMRDWNEAIEDFIITHKGDLLNDK